MKLEFSVVVAVLLVPVLSQRLLVVKQDGKGTKDKILRAYSLYSNATSGIISLTCSIQAPNATAGVNVYWKDTKVDVLSIDPSKNSSNNYTCGAYDADGKALPAWKETVLKYYQAADDMSIIESSNTGLLVNYSYAPDLTFICNGAKPPVYWFLDGKQLTTEKNIHINADNHSLIVKSAKFKDVGVYMCKSGDKLAFYSLEGMPFFLIKHGKDEDSENKLEGDSVNITHELYGNPLNDLVWTVMLNKEHVGERIDDSYLNTHLRFKLFPTVNVSNGELELSNLEKTDRAYYISRAENIHGNSSFTTLVRVKGKLDALWPFLGIVAEVIILVAIILIYERRRLKHESEADEAFDQKKPLTSTNSESVRQRKN